MPAPLRPPATPRCPDCGQPLRSSTVDGQARWGGGSAEKIHHWRCDNDACDRDVVDG